MANEGVDDFRWIRLESDLGCPRDATDIDPCFGRDPGVRPNFQAEWGGPTGAASGTTTKKLEHLSEPEEFLRAEPRIEVAADGRFLIAWFDGRVSTLQAVEPGATSPTAQWQGEDPINALTSSGADTYASLVDPETKADKGIYALGRSGNLRQLVPGRVDLVDRPAQGDDPGATWTRELKLSADSRTLVAVDCIAPTCDIQVIDASSGAIGPTLSSVPRGDVFGLDDAHAYGAFACRLGCAMNLDLRSGALMEVAVEQCGAGPGVVVLGRDGRFYLVATTSVPTRACARRSSVVAIDLAADMSRPVSDEQGEPTSVRALVVSNNRLAFALPRAAVVLGPAGDVTFDGRTLLVDIEARTVTPIFVQAP